MLAEQLEREPDLSIRLDRWHLTPGATLAEYMEEIAAVDSCIVVCTPAYAEKANRRSAGVGYEAQIITAQILAGTPGPKFIPLLREGDFVVALPVFLGGRLSLDFRKDDQFRVSLEALLRTLLDQPLYIPPAKGTPTLLQPHEHSNQIFGIGQSISQEARRNLLNTKREPVIRPEDARFGVALGFAMGRLEFVDGSRFPEATPAEQAIRFEIRQLLSREKDDDLTSASSEDARALMAIVINYFAVRDIKIHAAILIGIGALRLSLEGASSSPDNNAEIRKLALSAFMEIDSHVVADRQALFDNIAILNQINVPEICRILAIEVSG